MQVGNGISPQSTYRESVLAVVNAPMIDSEALDTGLNFSASRTNSKQTQAKIELGYFQDQSAIKKMGMFLVEKIYWIPFLNVLYMFYGSFDIA